MNLQKLAKHGGSEVYSLALNKTKASADLQRVLVLLQTVSDCFQAGNKRLHPVLARDRTRISKEGGTPAPYLDPIAPLHSLMRPERKHSNINNGGYLSGDKQCRA
jgi:hypothetical protein